MEKDELRDQLEAPVADIAEAKVAEIVEEQQQQHEPPPNSENNSTQDAELLPDEHMSQPESTEAEDKTKMPITLEKPASTEQQQQQQQQQCLSCQLLSDTLGSWLCCGPNQKKPSELSFSDVLLWKNVPVSGIFVVLGNVLYLLLQVVEVSLVSLIARCLFYPIILAFVFVVVRRAVQNEPPQSSSASSSSSSQQQSSDQAQSSGESTEDKNLLQPYVDAVVRQFNRFLNFYLSVLFCKNIWTTLKFAALVHLIAYLGTVLSTTNFLYIAFSLAFSVPKFYVTYDRQIDSILEKIQFHANETYQLVRSKIPIGAAAPAQQSQSKHKHKKNN